MEMKTKFVMQVLAVHQKQKNQCLQTNGSPLTTHLDVTSPPIAQINDHASHYT